MEESEQNYSDILRLFLEFEQEHDVFSIEENGVPVWERIRQGCFKEVLRKTGIEGKAHTRVDRDDSLNYIKGGAKWLKSLVRKNPFFEGSADFFFVGSSRRKLRDDGYQWDIFCDPILETLDLDYVYTETPYLLSHRTPAKTEDINYLDIITYTSVIQRELGLAACDLSEETKTELARLEEGFESAFGVSLDIQSKVCEKLSERKSRKWMYDQLLNRVDPNISVIVASAFKDTFIETCKDREIPVVELQHGGFGPDHLGYSHPNGGRRTTFPDYLFTFGELWRESVDLPIPDENVYPVGYPYLEDEKAKYQAVTENNQIIFISQGPKGDLISKFATNFAEQNEEYTIIYKLHPGEYHRWQEEYPWLDTDTMNIIDDDSIPLYKLFAESTVQVGVNSTALYEGLMFDLDTYIIDGPGTISVRYLLDEGIATKVSAVDEFQDHLDDEEHDATFDREYMFEPNPIQKVANAFEDILEREYGDS